MHYCFLINIQEIENKIPLYWAILLLVKRSKETPSFTTGMIYHLSILG